MCYKQEHRLHSRHQGSLLQKIQRLHSRHQGSLLQEIHRRKTELDKDKVVDSTQVCLQNRQQLVRQAAHQLSQQQKEIQKSARHHLEYYDILYRDIDSI